MIILRSAYRRMRLSALAVFWLTSAAAPERAPPFVLVLADGSTVSLDQLHDRVVILNFWATWCVPCKQELADIDGLVTVAGSGRVAAFAILAESKPDRRNVARRVERLHFPVAMRFERGEADYPLLNSGIPTTYVIDRGGKLVAKRAGAFRRGELAAIVVPLLERANVTERDTSR